MRKCTVKVTEKVTSTQPEDSAGGRTRGRLMSRETWTQTPVTRDRLCCRPLLVCPPVDTTTNNGSNPPSMSDGWAGQGWASGSFWNATQVDHYSAAEASHDSPRAAHVNPISYWFIASSSVPTSPSAIAFDDTRHRAHSTTSILDPAPVSDHSLEAACFAFGWLALKHIPRAEKDDKHDEGLQRSGDRSSANPASGSKPLFQWRHFTARTTYARLRFSLRCFFCFAVVDEMLHVCMHFDIPYLWLHLAWRSPSLFVTYHLRSTQTRRARVHTLFR